MSTAAILEMPKGARLAFHKTDGHEPGVIFLPGFRSDMEGTKALALEAHCRSRGQAFLRFDYSGHGQSSGKFEEGCIGQWRDDALAILDTQSNEPQILVGSSMGGWIALLLALARPEQVAGLVLIVPAPDFTRWGFRDNLDDAQRKALEEDGHFAIVSQYDPTPILITKKMLDDGEQHCLLENVINILHPVRIIHGGKDHDVPWNISRILTEKLKSEDVTLCLIKNGDHRLSNPGELHLLTATLDRLTAQIQSRP